MAAVAVICDSTSRLRRAASILLLVFAAVAAARDPTNESSAIITPHEGAPALVLAGGVLEVLVARQGELSIANDSSGVTLSPIWSQFSPARQLAKCPIPADCPPGAYGLNFTDATGRHQLPRAVFVYESFPTEYIVAHIAGPRIGATVAEASPYSAFTGILSAVNASGAALVLINGDLTNDGDIAQFRDFQSALNTCVLPTFVSPGPRDTASGNYTKFFGPSDHAATFGSDSFLVFDSTGLAGTDALGAQDAQLYSLRRSTRAARWSVGLTHRVPPVAALRTHLTLFVDDPLDFLLLGESPIETGALPWAKTGYLTTPSATAGAYRLITVNASEPSPGEVVRVGSALQEVPQSSPTWR